MPYDWRLILGIVVLIVISVLTYYGWQENDESSDSDVEVDSDEEEEVVESFADMILTEDIVSDPSKYRLTKTVIYFTNDIKECNASGSLSPRYIANLAHPLFEINYDWNVAWYRALYSAVRRLYRKTRKPLVLLVMSDLERVLYNYQKFADGKFCKINIPRWRFFNRSDERIQLGNLKSNQARGSAIHWATLGRTDVLRGELENHGLHVPKDPEGDYFYIWKDGKRYARGTLPNFRPSTVKKLYCAERGLLSDTRIGSALQYDPYTKKVVFTRNMKKARPQEHEVLFFLSWLSDIETNTDRYNNVVTSSRTVVLPVTRYVKDPCGTWREVRTNVTMQVKFEKEAILKKVLRTEETSFIQGNTSSLMNSQNILAGRINQGTTEAAGLTTERVALTKRYSEVYRQISFYRLLIGRYEAEKKARSLVKNVSKIIGRVGRGLGKIFGKRRRRRERFADYDSGAEEFADYNSDTEEFDSDDGYEPFEDDEEVVREGFKIKTSKTNSLSSFGSMPKTERKPKKKGGKKFKLPKVKPPKMSFKKLEKAFTKKNAIANVGKKTIKKIGKSKLYKVLKKGISRGFRGAKSVFRRKENKRRLAQLSLKIANARNELRKLEILRVAISTALQQNILQSFNLNTKINRYNSFKKTVHSLHWNVLLKMKQYVIEELEAGRIRVSGAPNRGDLPQEHMKYISDDGKLYITF